MRQPLPSCIGLGDDVSAACATLTSRGFAVVDDPKTASTERAIVLLSPSTDAATLAAVADALPNSALVILVTFVANDTPGPDADRFATTLEACQSLARRRRIVTIVGPDAATLPALVTLTCLLDDHALTGSDTTSTQSFIHATGIATRLWLPGKGEGSLVTRDVSDERMRSALCYYLSRQLLDGLLDPEQPSDSMDIAPLQGLIPTFAKAAATAVDAAPDLPLPQPTSPLTAPAYEAALDLAYRRARAGLEREREQWQEQSQRALFGVANQSDDRSAGLLAQIDRLLAEETRRRGLAETRRCVQAIESLFKRLGAGAPPIQLEPRIAALNTRRDLQRQRANDDGATVDAALESQRATAELFKLTRAWLLGQVVRELWRQCLDHLRRRAGMYELLHESLVTVREQHLPTLELCFRDLGLDLRDPNLGRFARAGGLTRSAAERAVLPGDAVVADSPLAIIAAMSRLAEEALVRDGRGDGSAGDEVAARLERAGLNSVGNTREGASEQILFGPGTEIDARKLAQRLGMRPRSHAIPHIGMLAWLRLSQRLPLSALLGRLGVQSSVDHIATPVTPLGHCLVTAAARVEYDSACHELATGSASKAIAAYRKATSAASVHQDPMAPTLVAVVRVMQCQNVNDLARIDEHFSMAACDVNRPERVIIELACDIASTLRKLQELEHDDSGRITYLRDAERHCWQTAELSRESLSDPEASLLATAFERIGSQLRSALSEVHGRAEVVMRLLTEKLAYVTQTRIELKLINVSQVAANDLRIRVAKSDRLRLLSAAEIVLEQLGPGLETVCGFDVKPLQAGSRAVTVKLSYADHSKSRREKALTANIELIPVRASFKRLELNPFVAGPPIKSAEMFFGRDDVLDFIVDNLRQHQDNLLLLHGSRRTGKSSVLYRLESEPRLQSYVVVYFDLQGQAELTTRSLLGAIATRMTRALKKRGLDAPALPRTSDLTDTPFEAFLEFLDDVEDVLSPSYRALVLMDEFELLESKVKQGALTADIFPFLRSVMQHSNSVSFVMAGTRRLDEMDPAYWAVLYGLVRDRAIGFLAEPETRQLITAPLAGLVELDDLAIEAILRLTSGHPYYTQLVCQTLVNELNRKAVRNWVAPSDVADAAQLVLTLGGGQITHEWTGVASSTHRLLLATLAELAGDAAIRVEREQLFTRLQHSCADVTRQQFEQAVADLNKRELIQSPTADGVVSFRMDLMRQWVRQEKPVSIVLAEGAR